jgi:hypothetical protein
VLRSLQSYVRALAEIVRIGQMLESPTGADPASGATTR